MLSDDVEGAGNEQEFDPLDFLSDTPSEITSDSDSPYDANRDMYEGLDFSLRALSDE